MQTKYFERANIESTFNPESISQNLLLVKLN